MSSCLSAGTTLDATVLGEVRESLLSEPVADGFGNQLSAATVTPALRLAHQNREWLFDVGYAPQLSVVYPSEQYFLVVNRAQTQITYSPTPRLRLAFDAVGSIGDQDAGTAIRSLPNSRVRAVVGGGNLSSFPFGEADGGFTGAYRLDSRLSVNSTARLNMTGTPSAGDDENEILPFQVRPVATVGAAYLLTPTDSVQADIEVRGGAIADDFGVLAGRGGGGGGFIGVLPIAGYNRQLIDGVVATTRVGWFMGVVDEGLRTDLIAIGNPLLDVAVRAAVDLPGGGAIEGRILGGLTPTSDPLGGLIEERINVGIQGAWRVNRDLSLTTGIDAFGTLYAVGGNADIADENAATLGGTFAMTYNLGEWVALNASVIGQTNLVADKFGNLVELRPEMIFTVGIIGAMNLFRDGARPQGTDPRPGRIIGEQGVSLPGSARAVTGRRPPPPKKSDVNLKEVKDKDIKEKIIEARRKGIVIDEKKLVKKLMAEKKKKDIDQRRKDDPLAYLKEKAERDQAEQKAAEAEADARKKRKKKSAAAEAAAAAEEAEKKKKQ